MDSGKLLELAIIVIILAGIGYVIWRGGAANPVGTGTLQHKLKNMGHEFTAMGGKLSSLSDQLEKLQQGSASADDIERVRAELLEEQARTNKVFEALGKVDLDLRAMREDQAIKHEIIGALSESVRTISAELKAHREDVAEKLDTLDAMSERIDANLRAIGSISSQLPEIRDTQGSIAREVSAIATETKVTARQVDRLYDVIVTKGMAQ